MFKKSHYKALGIVGLLTVILVFCLPKNTTGQIKLAIGSFFLPLFGVSRTTNQVIEETGDALMTRADLLRLVEQLRRTNQVLLIQSHQTAEILSENERLRQSLNWRRNSPWKDRLKRARVVARDPANWWQTITIDIGSSQGMREDFPVLTDEGLVGRIKSVGPLQSVVVLVSDPTCKVSAKIEKTHELGIISGRDNMFNKTLVPLSHLSSNSAIKPGMSVFTSGIGGIFPEGIPIGKIAEEPSQVDSGQSLEARVKLATDLNAVDEVWVLTMP